MQKISVNEYFTREERKALLQKDNFRASLEIILHWGIIIAVFAFVYFWTNPLSIFIASFLLGGQQLACSILMHDSGHQAVFKNQKINDFVGEWLGAYPIFHNMLIYRPYHNIHHVHTGLEEDPDLLLTRGYPTSRKSMMRKFFRDFTGQTGVKSLIGLQLMTLGFLEYNLGGKLVKINQSNRTWKEFFAVLVKNWTGPITANLLLFGIFSLVASSWLYLLWLVSYFTTFQFVLRVRSMAEHSMLEDSTNPFQNTRTTYANWFERLLFAPYHVNYHTEHHMLMAVPSYNLPKMHRLLKERGFYEKGVLEMNYLEILKLAIKK